MEVIHFNLRPDPPGETNVVTNVDLNTHADGVIATWDPPTPLEGMGISADRFFKAEHFDRNHTSIEIIPASPQSNIGSAIFSNLPREDDYIKIYYYSPSSTNFVSAIIIEDVVIKDPPHKGFFRRIISRISRFFRPR